MLRLQPKFVVLLVALWMAGAIAEAPDVGLHAVSSTTREHLDHEPWWPTRQVANQSKFAGTSTCTQCHGGIVRTQAATEMARTLMPAASSPVLAAHLGDVFSLGAYRYGISKVGSSYELKVSDGQHSRDDALQWALGSGNPAQSFLWWKDGQAYESRFNYFASSNSFDRTPGRLQGTPLSLDMAEGRKVAEFELRKCLSCHTTALTTAGPLSAAQFHPGITCEGCHGPGRGHVVAVRAVSDQLSIVNPAHLSPAKAVDFCGACHGTAKDVELAGTAGKISVRFPAYRLEKSRCWATTGDARLTCFACHDPHRPLQREEQAYDAACLRCHANQNQHESQVSAKQRSCTVATSRCTSCHMPKYEAPGMHYAFTDHDIRIVRPNAPFPE